MGQGGKKRIGLIGRIIWLINIVVAVTMLLSYLSSYVDPLVTTLFSFLGLAYLPLLLLNLVFFLYWLIRRRNKLWLSLVVIIIGFNIFTRHIQIMPGREAPTENVISLLSYNVQNMAHSNTGLSNIKIRNDILSFLSTHHADIVCLQEYSSRGSNHPGSFADLTENLDYPHIFYASYYPRKKQYFEGKVILSKFPAIDTVILSIPGSPHILGIYADLLINEDTVRVYNLHLESIRFQHEDYQFVEDVSKGEAEQGELRKGSSSIIRKLYAAFRNRSKEAKVVVNSLAECPYPVIICGDFNDTPLSYAYHRISKGLDDAFVDAGYGLGNTFNGKLPPVRIDFILYSPLFRSYDFRVHDISRSDHFPVSAYLSKISGE